MVLIADKLLLTSKSLGSSLLNEARYCMSARNDDKKGGDTVESERSLCQDCKGTRRCGVCDGSGYWYEGTSREEVCACCRGSGRCPSCCVLELDI